MSMKTPIVHESHLEAKVAGLNELNRHIIALRPVIANLVNTKFLGRKIVNANGKVTKAFSDAVSEVMPKELHDWDFNIYSYSIYLGVRFCNGYKYGNPHDETCYSEKTVQIVCMDADKIVKSSNITENIQYNESEAFRTNFTVQEIIEKREALREAEKVVIRMNTALFDFGKSDSH